MSTGFIGIALAAHLCSSVTIYGFEAGTGKNKHYYNKVSSRVEGNERPAALPPPRGPGRPLALADPSLTIAPLKRDANHSPFSLFLDEHAWPFGLAQEAPLGT